MSKDKKDLAKLSDMAHEKKLWNRKSAPPAKKPDLTRSIVSESNDVLDSVYEYLGGVQGSQIYWKNREDEFRTLIEAKILVKRATADIDIQEAAQTGKNIFAMFIQNNGLVKPEEKEEEVEEATVVEDKKDDA